MKMSAADRSPRLGRPAGPCGFGNVLAGLSRNTRAEFIAGPATLSVSLDGAAPEVAAFEACGVAPVA